MIHVRTARLAVSLFLATVIASIAIAQEPAPSDDMNSGIVHGKGHAFIIKAPRGWVLDTTSGVDQGLYAVFYPAGGSWARSDVVMYVNTATRGPDETLDGFIGGELARSRERSPDLIATPVDSLATLRGRATTVRQLTGDRWGNHEAIAYLDEEKVFVMFVLSAKYRSLYDGSYDAFRELVGSYDFLTEHVVPTD